VTGVAAQRVLLCGGSRVYATALSRALDHEGDITVVEVCRTAEEAIAALPRIRPDLVIMNLQLPGMDGLAAVQEIMSSRPVPILVILARVSTGGDGAAAALAAGALDAITSDDLDLRDPAGAAGAAFRQRIRALSRAHVIRHPRATLGQAAASRPPRLASVIGVCASAGGPQLLASLLGALPPGYPIPLLIVQHIAAGFTDGLVRWLDQSVLLPVGTAEPGARPAPGAWIAPEGGHLTLAATGRLKLDRHTAAGRHRPSGDVLLSSIAAAAGRAGVAVVLSGIGSDGAAGAAAVHRRGGLAIAQDEQSSAVFGMPRAAIDLGVNVVLPPGDIAARLLALHYEPLPMER
jgi:two-component system chemotaxis response regulator CheB